MIYVYGIVDNPSVPLDGCGGLGDADTSIVAHGPIGAVVSTHDQLAQTVRLADLQQHHRVLETLMAHCTVVPARFGTLFDRRADLEEVLELKEPRLLEIITRFRGKVELSLRAQLPADHPPVWLDEIYARLQQRCVASVATSRTEKSLAAAFLLRSTGVTSFQVAAARLVDANPAVLASLTGPWPPYSFTEPEPSVDEAPTMAPSGWSG